MNAASEKHKIHPFFAFRIIDDLRLGLTDLEVGELSPMFSNRSRALHDREVLKEHLGEYFLITITFTRQMKSRSSSELSSAASGFPWNWNITQNSFVRSVNVSSIV